MSIETALQTAQQRVASAYSSVSTMGGTLPATQNLSNLPSAIESIPSGGGTKYGCDVNNFLGDVNASGVLQFPRDTSGDIVFTGVKDVDRYVLAYKFYQNSNLTNGVSFPDLENVSGTYACAYMFYNCDGITSVDLSSLKTISGTNACASMFYDNDNIQSVDLSSLETISGNGGANYMFRGSSIQQMDLGSLKMVSGSGACTGMLVGCQKLGSVYFNSLTTSSFDSYTNQFSNMFSSTTGSQATGGCTVHFPSNLQSTIAGLTGYPTFGGSSSYIHLAFDLPATS